MLNKLNSLRDREDGFTLIELLIVVIIIGILAAIALPIFIDQQKVAIDASVASDVRNTVTNVTNAQASGDTTFTTAKSRAESNITVNNPAATPVTVTPKLGDPYTVSGWNAGGKKYLEAKPFTFTASTGQFA